MLSGGIRSLIAFVVPSKASYFSFWDGHLFPTAVALRSHERIHLEYTLTDSLNEEDMNNYMDPTFSSAIIMCSFQNHIISLPSLCFIDPWHLLPYFRCPIGSGPNHLDPVDARDSALDKVYRPPAWQDRLARRKNLPTILFSIETDPCTVIVGARVKPPLNSLLDITAVTLLYTVLNIFLQQEVLGRSCFKHCPLLTRRRLCTGCLMNGWPHCTISQNVGQRETRRNIRCVHIQ